MSDVLSKIRFERPVRTEPRLLEVGDEDARDVLAALSGETTSLVLEALHREPATPSDLAERVDTSLQNVHYHLEKLQSAGLIEASGTQYSEKGREMTVYAPANDPIVLVGDRSAGGELRDLLDRWAGAIVVLAAVSLLVQAFADRVATGASPNVGPAGVYAASDGPASILLWGIEPGLLVFLGGVVVVATALLRRRYSRS